MGVEILIRWDTLRVFWNWIWELVFGKVKNGEFFRRMGVFGMVEVAFLGYLMG